MAFSLGCNLVSDYSVPGPTEGRGVSSFPEQVSVSTITVAWTSFNETLNSLRESVADPRGAEFLVRRGYRWVLKRATWAALWRVIWQCNVGFHFYRRRKVFPLQYLKNIFTMHYQPCILANTKKNVYLACQIFLINIFFGKYSLCFYNTTRLIWLIY